MGGTGSGFHCDEEVRLKEGSIKGYSGLNFPVSTRGGVLGFIIGWPRCGAKGKERVVEFESCQ